MAASIIVVEGKEGRTTSETYVILERLTTRHHYSFLTTSENLLWTETTQSFILPWSKRTHPNRTQETQSQSSELPDLIGLQYEINPFSVTQPKRPSTSTQRSGVRPHPGCVSVYMCVCGAHEGWGYVRRLGACVYVHTKVGDTFVY